MVSAVTSGGNQTEVFAPVVRGRLIEAIAARASFPIVLVVAPAGYGKSVAMRQYLVTLKEPIVQFELEAEHGALLGFLRGLAQAFYAVAPHALATLPDAYERTRSSSRQTEELARWMHAHLEPFHGVVALDDLHVADGDADVAAFLVALIERTKGSVRWILASRSTLRLPVATWIVRRDADIPIDELDLRFNLHEARAAGFETSDEELADLLSFTDGWPAAVSFALRTSTRSTDIRRASAATRDMIYKYLAEQVYAMLSEEERDFLELAIALPAIDVRVMEKAGVDRALPIVERLRARTAFIYEEKAGVYRCHDLFRDFLSRQSLLSGRSRYKSVHARAAKALEASGDLEHAIAACVAAEAPADVVRLLESTGFELLERARADVVMAGISALDERTKQENATILALRGSLQAVAGKLARAETLLRRALSRAGDDRNLTALISLRLARLLGNRGEEVTVLLGRVATDPSRGPACRAEALSLIGAQRAMAGDASVGVLVREIEAMLGFIDSDITRAKVLHYLGIISRRVGEVDRAFEFLIQSSELAAELHLYALASRVNSALSNLALHEEDDVNKQFHFAAAAAEAASKSGDMYALEIALLQMLSAEMRRGSLEGSAMIEQRLSEIQAAGEQISM